MNLVQKFIVISMGTDPEPDDPIGLFHAEGAILRSNAHGP